MKTQNIYSGNKCIRDVSGASAVEFAMIAPVLILMIFGIFSFGYLFGVYNGVQQLSAEAARTTVAGLSDVERDQLARAFIASSVKSYSFLDPKKLQISTGPMVGGATGFQVSLNYDLTGSFIYEFTNSLGLPKPNVQRTSVVQRGGY